MDNYTSQEPANSIAIIGMSCRFPRAKNPEEFWKVLRDGVECVHEITEQDLIAAGFNPVVMQHPSYVNRQVVLEDIDQFDADFFGYLPRDAEILDPQQRFMLECAWEALENAGYDPATCKEVIGIYGGTDMSQYLFNLYSNREVMEAVGVFAINLANDKDHVTTRVAYKLNLKGPAVTVQTTCSTSLVAICQACQSLLNYQCDIALAGGTAISLPQKIGYVYQEGGIASPDGYCRTFDAKAQGTIGGSGTGVVALKRLEEALEDGDNIHAIIRGFAINNDGSLKVGYTAPSIDGQSEAIAMAQAMAEVDPETITYIEAHGTATPLGDPIEIKALSQVFRASTDKKRFCGIGSVKTNIGHLNSAAGVAGLMKAVLALKYQMLPPSLHFEKPNPNIDFDNSPFYVVDKLIPWISNNGPLRAGVSSFGIGGTNAHVVLEEFPSRSSEISKRRWQLLLLSAKSWEALRALIHNLGNYLNHQPHLNIADVAFTLTVGRPNFHFRKAIIVPTDGTQAGQFLLREELLRDESSHFTGKEKQVVFLFPGQGAQHVYMGKELYVAEPFFKEQLDHCCEILVHLLPLDIRELLFPDPEREKEATQQLTQTHYTQPALFVIEYALAQLWLHWGIRPWAMAGHSIGEYVAATLAGVFTLEDALALVVDRGRLMQSMPPGEMLAVHLPEKEILNLLPSGLSLAAVNGPSLCVVAGPKETMAALEVVLTDKGVFYSRLKTSHAFHSNMFEPIVSAFADRVKQVPLKTPSLRFLSNKTGTWITPEEATNPNYWAMHLRNTVRFADNLRELFREQNKVLLEVGPGTSLSTLARQFQSAKSSTTILSSLPHPKDQLPDDRFLMTTLGKLWSEGVAPDWKTYYSAEKRYRLPLPTYPFQRKRYWITPEPVTNGKSSAVNLKRDMVHWFYLPSWETTSPLQEVPPSQAPAECWLIFMDTYGLGDQLVTQLTGLGQKVITVHIGSSFQQEGAFSYRINPTIQDDYKALFLTLRQRQLSPTTILQLWNIMKREESSKEVFSEEKSYDSFFSMLFLGQVLGEVLPDLHCRILLATYCLYQVVGHEWVRPDQALAVGAGKVISQEFPHYTFLHVDMDTNFQSKSSVAEDALRLQKEALYGDPATPIAIRLASRWKLQYREVLPKEIDHHKLRLRPNGVYLITGGLGGIGLVLAWYLAKYKKARLVLTGRSTLPKTEEWEGWIREKGTEDPISRKILKIRELENLGSKVLAVSADVTKRQDVIRLAQAIEKQFGRLHGIIHAAGVAGGGVISLKTREQARHVLAPKVKGTLLLQEVLAKADLDFFMLCSSLSAILGGIGQVDYCAANCFQDAFAHQHARRNRTYYLSINWDTWAEVGMAVETEVPQELKALQEEGLKRGIHNQEGMQLFEQMMGSEFSQIATSTTDLSARYQLPDVALPQEEIQEISTPKVNLTSKHPRPTLSTEYVPSTSLLQEKIALIWEELLGIHPIGMNDNFLELGGHSLLAVQLISRLRDLLKIEVTIQSFFEAPTIGAISQLVEGGQNDTGEQKPTTGESASIMSVSREQYRTKLTPEGNIDLPNAMKPKKDEE